VPREYSSAAGDRRLARHSSSESESVATTTCILCRVALHAPPNKDWGHTPRPGCTPEDAELQHSCKSLQGPHRQFVQPCMSLLTLARQGMSTHPRAIISSHHRASAEQVTNHSLLGYYCCCCCLQDLVLVQQPRLAGFA
jgi:hypothetical protein